MKTTRGFAPAKINLTLHVTGQRADGYHLLDSLVAFASVGDIISAQVAPALFLDVAGPFASGVPTDHSNLVLKAATLLARGQKRGAHLVLEKCLPPSSGIGGGSADAAATLRVLADLWHLDLPSQEAILALGADVPVCLRERATRMAGIGDVLSDVAALPDVPIVLINPRVEVPTPQVFARLTRKSHAAMPDVIPTFSDTPDLVGWLAQHRNDLQPPAISLQPVIGDVLVRLAASQGCLLSRMSGSGATCFGVFASQQIAAQAAQVLQAQNPDWWVAQAILS
ncbi:MAG: 4-diphosphocytidyl-2-C-methyl-D-erythritol kinase [Paracoccaceae bacterium]|jgi:4-diphosphocytidyl-2-C-methyl-D-erythritol kinase